MEVEGKIWTPTVSNSWDTATTTLFEFVLLKLKREEQLLHVHELIYLILMQLDQLLLLF